MKNWIVGIFIICCLNASAQTIKPIKFGKQTYDVKYTKANGGGEFQLVTLEEESNLYELIVKMIQSKEIACYEAVSEKTLLLKPAELTLSYVTYEASRSMLAMIT